MNSKIILEYLQNEFSGDFLQQEPLAEHTWYKIGGPADLLIFPRKINEVENILQLAHQAGLSVFIIGAGANLLVSDDGFRGIVISLSRYLHKFGLTDNILTSESGADLQKLVNFTINEGFQGFEYLTGIPGTLGGALAMNAGNDQAVISDYLIDVDVIDENFEIKKILREQVGFAYRLAPALQGCAILSARFALKPGSIDNLRMIQQDLSALRSNRQPLQYPSCGSVFKRPPGHFAGKLIEDLGLKGLRKGDAMVSPKHAGFIVNLGKAKAADVTYLIDYIQKDVFENFGIKLELEVRLLGFPESSD